MPDREAIISQIQSEIPRLRRYARYLARDVDHADDLVQDCLVRALANIDSWQPGTNLRAWLITILRNGFFNDCRRASKDRRIVVEKKASGPEILPAQQDFVLVLAEVEAAFKKLSTDHREVLTLVAVEGLSYEQSADCLGVSIGTVKSRLSRARSQLSHLLDDPDHFREVS
jgi:RNA polymerase sigma-70 factor (ECF subfamily)